MENNNFINLLGEKIHVYVENTNKKNKVLLLHGFNSSFNIYKNLISEKDRNFDIATFDFPGCGLSSYNNKINLELYKLVTIEFIKKYNLQNCVIISHSLGAISALEALKNNFAQYAILTSPFNYFLNLESFIKNNTPTKELIKIQKNNNQNTELKAKITQKLDFAKNLINSSRFKNLLTQEMLNKKYVQNQVKPLYFLTDKYSIVTGTIDLIVPLLSCKQLVKNTNKELLTFKYSHKFWQNISNMDLQILIELIERSFCA
ncbi:alpha/beta fold hydrolase [Mycoplasma zalophi]|uniref:alpha/beta fold hydrolase n=1 Tax=Mycoplasma zalophi TaxID=191287 RepID=UPI001C125577|nr:alpha/beta hydrolase [Mycoplasma zalophi]MBU4691074.1 alpha/beta hydrolase [Mycoplasma zalophi]